MTRTKADIKIDTITLETGSEGLIRAGQEVVLRVHGGDSNCPSFQCATTSGLVVGSLDGEKLQFLTPSNLPNVTARIQTIKRSCDGGLEDVVVRVREKLKSEIPFGTVSGAMLVMLYELYEFEVNRLRCKSNSIDFNVF